MTSDKVLAPGNHVNLNLRYQIPGPIVLVSTLWLPCLGWPSVLALYTVKPWGFMFLCQIIDRYIMNR